MARNRLARQVYVPRRTPCGHCGSRRTIAHSPTQVACDDCQRTSTVRKRRTRADGPTGNGTDTPAR